MGKRDNRKKGKDCGTKVKKASGSRAESDNEDLDLILEEYTKSLEEKGKVVMSDDIVPSPRVNCSFVLNPLNDSEGILFGGEFRDGDKMYYYSDLFKYNFEKMSWKKVTSQTCPKPRSSHQMAACPNGKLVIFGGEFGTPTDTKFLHHRDCWLLDPKTMSWELLEGTIPPPRSGHRMTTWRSLVVMFGGFYDDGRQTKYLDDLWIMDSKSYIWTKVQIKGEKPTARSGFVFAPCDDGIILYGGYHVARDAKGVDDGKCMNDMWLLKLPKGEESDPSHWERLKYAPVMPLKSGCSACVLKNTLYLFGGIVDNNVGDEYINGVCQNDLFTMDLSRLGHWRKFEASGSLPIGRYNSMMLCSGKDIYIFGGINEVGDVEVCLDDIWNLKNGTWTCKKPLSVTIPSPRESDTEDEGIDDSSDSDDTDVSISDCESDGSESDEEDEESEYEYSKPLDGEALKDYFQRTQQEYLDAINSNGELVDAKKARNDAFLAAQSSFKSFNLK